MAAVLDQARARLAATDLLNLDAGRARRALALATEDDAVAELEAEQQAADIRRMERLPRRFGLAVQPQCPGCSRFVQSLARECPSCGYFGAAGYPG